MHGPPVHRLLSQSEPHNERNRIMSVARLHTVAKARKDQGKCEKCGKALPAGSPYRHFTVGFRSKWKRVVCTDPACTPRPSQRESSSKSGPMAAIEDFQDLDITSLDDLTSAYEDVKSAFEEYAQECEDGAEAWENGNSQMEERAEMAREAADSLDQFDPEPYYPEDDTVDVDNLQEGDPEWDNLQEHIQQQREEAIEQINEAEGMWA